VGAAEAATLAAQLRAAQAGEAGPYRLALRWVARRAEAEAAARGLRPDATAQAALRLVHALRHTYDPARDPVAWVDALVEEAALQVTPPRGARIWRALLDALRPRLPSERAP